MEEIESVDIKILSTRACRQMDLLANIRPDLRSSYAKNKHSFDTVWILWTTDCAWICVCGDTYYRKIVDVISNNDGCRGTCAPIGKGYSQEAISWLKTVAQTEGIEIQYAGNGGEKRIYHSGKHYFKCDGFCAETNTVYEYHGSYWHGKAANDYNSVSKKANHIAMEKTREREELIKSMGYTLVVMWDYEWKQICRQR